MVGMIDLRDIVHATSNLCRFNGHGRRFMSVAEHMVRCCLLAEVDHGVRSVVAHCALLHDAAEAYVSDVPSPLKELLPDYKRVEDRIAEVIAVALSLPVQNSPRWAQAKEYDVIALHLEGAELFHPTPSWVQPVDSRFDCVREFGCLNPAQARVEFAKKLAEYGYGGRLRT